jgi:hypothetical protein
MNIRVIVEEPVAILTARNADDTGEVLRLFRSDIELAEVGASWTPRNASDTQVSRRDEILTVVYKDSFGTAFVRKAFGTTDNGTSWDEEPQLVWMERAK